MRLDPDVLLAAALEAGLTPASIVVAPLDVAAGAVAVEPGLALYPASMIKVPLVAAALNDIASGHLPPLDSTVTVEPANMTANDSASPMVPGYEPTLRELMWFTIARSDNVATNVLFDLVGRERATQIARDRLGLPDTAFYRKLSGSEPLINDPGWDGIHRNTHPAADCAHLMRAIAESAIPQAALLREMLGAQEWNEKLSGGLLSWDRFLHKTGDTSEVTHDGGILITGEGERFVIVVYTGLPSAPENNARFAPFMRRIREQL
ncbi:MAG TPA: serine hydrolase [Candidatus Baltobacteraceae bacterium]|nr:serine hydrolase [Candidatus Baltobacteraceae bacterium]